MKCPQCEEEMKRVNVVYTNADEYYALDLATKRYSFEIEETDDPTYEDMEYQCDNCGFVLEGHILDTFLGLILEE